MSENTFEVEWIISWRIIYDVDSYRRKRKHESFLGYLIGQFASLIIKKRESKFF